MNIRPRAAGFTLVEVICAVAILGIALVGLTEGITSALASSKESEVQTAAALIAAGQIESLRSEGGLTDGETEGEAQGGESLYRWKKTISPTSLDGLHEVTVVVRDSRNEHAIYELRTLLFEPPDSTSPDGTAARPRGTASARSRATR